jgi:hypothetical protein
VAAPSAFPERFDFGKMHLPAAERACEHEPVWLDECIFRAGRQGWMTLWLLSKRSNLC